MQKSRTVRWIFPCVLVVVMGAGGSQLPAVALSQASAGDPTPSTVMVTPGWASTSEKTVSSGTLPAIRVADFSKGPQRISVASDVSDTSQVSILSDRQTKDKSGKTGGEMSVGVAVGNSTPKTAAGARNFGVRGESAESHVKRQLMAVSGLSDAQAKAWVAEFLGAAPTATSERRTAVPRLLRAASPAGASTTAPYTSWCVKIDRTETYSYGCIVTYLDWANGSDWYLSEKLKNSFYTRGSWRLPAKYKIFTNHDGYTSVVDWDPYSLREDTGSGCQNQSVGIDVAKTGASYSQSADVCQGAIGSYGPYGSAGGGIWQGNLLYVWPGKTYGDIADLYIHCPSLCSYSRTTLNLSAEWKG